MSYIGSSDNSELIPSAIPEKDIQQQSHICDPNEGSKIRINYQGTSNNNMALYNYPTTQANPSIYTTEPAEAVAVDTIKTPQRPEDLINKVSFTVSKANLASSAQYRKSYAFKIWRDKGFFPYRLAKEVVVEEGRQKSKRLLNALKAQRDRENEEAWRAFKSSKALDKRSHKTKRVQEKEKGLKQQKNKTPVSLHEETDERSRNAAVQHSIPTYFKTKKDATSSKLASQSVPTSVIHVMSTVKTYQKSQSSIQMEHKCPNDALAQEGECGKIVAVGVSSVVSPTIRSVRNDTNPTTNLTSGVQGTTTNKVPSPTPASTSNLFDDTLATLQNFTEPSIISSPSQTNAADAMILEHGEVLADTAEADVPEQNNNSNLPPSSDNAVTVTPCASELAAAIKNTLDRKYCKENFEPVPRHGTLKRSRGSNHTSPGKVKSRKLTVFTKLDEKFATNLADGIHNVNSEYFPIGALANKAAKETQALGVQKEDGFQGSEQKVEEIGRARLLLKELFDVTLESDEDGEMRTFDAESRSFGRKNILNHLSLLDRYFAELQKKLSTGGP